MSVKTSLTEIRDFWAGAMFVLVGGAAVFIARDYRFGSALRMGPGFFPTILGVVLVGLGICVMASGIRNREKIEFRVSPRALVLIPLSLVLFGKLVQWAGFIPAVLAIIFVSAASRRGVRFTEVLLLAGALAAMSGALFIWALKLPYPLVKGF